MRSIRRGTDSSLRILFFVHGPLDKSIWLESPNSQRVAISSELALLSSAQHSQCPRVSSSLQRLGASRVPLLLWCCTNHHHINLGPSAVALPAMLNGWKKMHLIPSELRYYYNPHAIFKNDIVLRYSWWSWEQCIPMEEYTSSCMTNIRQVLRSWTWRNTSGHFRERSKSNYRIWIVRLRFQSARFVYAETAT